MDGIIKNRSDQWENPNLQRKVLAEVQTVFKLRDMLDCPDLFSYVVDFIIDQFPMGERDDGNKGSAKWWDESLAVEKTIPNITVDEFFNLATHRLEVNKEDA